MATLYGPCSGGFFGKFSFFMAQEFFFPLPVTVLARASPEDVPLFGHIPVRLFV